MIWVRLDKLRPGVVVAVQDNGRLLVIGGTSTSRTLPRVELLPANPLGKALDLSKPTYFYAAGLASVRPDEVDRVVAQCPPDIFEALRAIITPFLQGLTSKP